MSSTKVHPAPGSPSAWSPPGAPAVLEMPCDSSSFDVPHEESRKLPAKKEILTDKMVFQAELQAELQAFAQKELRRELRRELEDFGARLQASLQQPVWGSSEEEFLRSAAFRPDTPNSIIHVPEYTFPEKEGKVSTLGLQSISSEGMTRSDSDSLEDDQLPKKQDKKVSLDLVSAFFSAAWGKLGRHQNQARVGSFYSPRSSNASENEKVQTTLSKGSMPDSEKPNRRSNTQATRRRSLNYRQHIIAKSEMQLTRQQTGQLPARVSQNSGDSKLSTATDSEAEDSWSTKTLLHGHRMMKCCRRMETILEYPVMFIIVMNGLFLGIQAQYQSENRTQAVPEVFLYVELLFCVFFSSELGIHLWSQGIMFYSCARKGWKWNYFDTFLVAVQIVEVFGMFVTDHESQNASAAANFSHMRMLRILRVFLVLRLVRLLHFVGELKTIVSSILNSMRSLFWTVVLLFLVIYIFGIIFTQLAVNARMTTSNLQLDALAESNMEALDYWWGTLFRACLTLYEAILGGCDWDQVIVPFMDRVSVFVGPIFISYIAFAVLAMMNVITGIFVDSALNNAAKEKNGDFMDAFRAIFAGVMDCSGKVTLSEFEARLGMEELSAQVRSVGIDPKDAALTFSIIDKDGSGCLHVEDLLAGLLCLRRQAKSMDIAMLLHVVDEQGLALKDMLEKDAVRKAQRNIDRATTAPPWQTGQPNGYQGPVFYVPGVTPLGFCDDWEV